ncbi:unnamed protein product [Spirodela intermedia]|uniref:Uncharacterized protein n=1 Tax=Spirodela intermedia TaxID=51605 RepID=A0A7I8L0R3_SPIIN|nr:unnamed protein product [Spirodela intermedia]
MAPVVSASLAPTTRFPSPSPDPIGRRRRLPSPRLTSAPTLPHAAPDPRAHVSMPPAPNIGRKGETKLAVWTSIQQESWEGDLVVEGHIPPRLKETYLRNGRGLWNIEDHDFVHMFDGYATLVGVHFDDGRVKAGHRQIQSEAYKAALKNKRLCYREFSENPRTENLLAYIGELAGLFSGSSLTDNANISVIELGDRRVICMAETIKGTIHCSHPIVTDSEYLTLLPDLVRPGYQVVRMEPGSNVRRLIGRVDCRGGPTARWAHWFPVTENYVVVPGMPLRYSVKNILRSEPTPLFKFEWHPDSGAFIHFMCKTSGSIVASVEVPQYLTFHFINAYEEQDGDGRVVAIVADCCEHNADPAILEKLTLQNLRSFSGVDSLPDARVERFRIPLDGTPRGLLEAALDPEHHGRGMDMRSINPKYMGKKYRYAYACGAKRPCNFPNALTKIDLVEKTTRTWHQEGAVPSEPLLVERPGAVREDDGVVISLVSGKDGEGYVLLLDGSTFEEIARGGLPYGLPYGLHECWVPRT